MNTVPSTIKPLVYAVTTPKGGVGKTTTLTALSLYAAMRGKKCLLIDLDNIGSFTNNFQGADVRHSELSDVRDLFKDPDLGAQINVSVISENLHLIQGHSDVADVNRTTDLTLITRMKDNLLENLPGYTSYDYVFIDTPAGNGNTVAAALIFANRIYSPIDLDHNAIGSLAELTKMLKPIRRSLNPSLYWVGFVINRVPKLVRTLGRKVPEATADRVIYEGLVENYGEKALLGVIASRNPIKQSLSSGSWISGSDPSAQEAAAELEQFCKKVLEIN